MLLTAKERRRLHQLVGVIESLEQSSHDLRVIIDVDPYDLLSSASLSMVVLPALSMPGLGTRKVNHHLQHRLG